MKKDPNGDKIKGSVNVSRVAKINYPEILGGGKEEQKKRKKVLKPVKFQKQNTNIKKTTSCSSRKRG